MIYFNKNSSTLQTSVPVTDPNFFYVVDLNEKGYMRNLFWTDARSRVASAYFCDVIASDTVCLTYKFEAPLVAFIGENHHAILLGCASHCFILSRIRQGIPDTMGELFYFEATQVSLNRVVHYFLEPEEFEAAWEEMTQRHGIRDHRWIHEDRKKGVPAYSKDTGRNENHRLESLADMDLRNSSFMLKPRCYLELQLSRLYKKKILRRFIRRWRACSPVLEQDKLMLMGR
uniref:Protein FAR1-RELATED SEQUENCE n=1 Tax=Populus trichocarpa TaxID=3694 RepID=U5GL76_POPTR